MANSFKEQKIPGSFMESATLWLAATEHKTLVAYLVQLITR